METIKQIKGIYKELEKGHNNGNFDYEPNKYTEIHFSLCEATIIVEHFRTGSHLIEPFKKECYFGLYGCLGRQDMEEKFIEIMYGNY